MANTTKSAFLEELERRYGNIHKLRHSLSLYDLGEGAGRIYIRYSKVHSPGRTFYGLRKKDLQQLEGRASIICFLWEGQTEPLFVPYSEYEEIFQSLSPADDGQYKAQVFIQEEGCDLYIANAGRFNLFGLYSPPLAAKSKSQSTKIPRCLRRGDSLSRRTLAGNNWIR